MQHLDFEAAISELDTKIHELKNMSSQGEVDVLQEITALQTKRDKHLSTLYSKLSPWQKVMVARHPERPHFMHYLKAIFEDFFELKGDRLYGNDNAVIGGLATFQGQTVMVIGQEKGHDIETRMKHNFGMPVPDGYRKAQRLMKMADHFGYPIFTFIDTAGAYPGLASEERGQAEAIARSMDVCFSVQVPIITTVIGEGGSGGAIAIGVANRVLMLEHSIYSVISPEGCASILWRSAEKKEDAAKAQKLTAQDLLQLKVIDHIIQEPLGGAHRDPSLMIDTLTKTLKKELATLAKLAPDALKRQRRQKFLAMGQGIS